MLLWAAYDLRSSIVQPIPGKASRRQGVHCEQAGGDSFDYVERDLDMTLGMLLRLQGLAHPEPAERQMLLPVSLAYLSETTCAIFLVEILTATIAKIVAEFGSVRDQMKFARCDIDIERIANQSDLNIGRIR